MIFINPIIVIFIPIFWIILRTLMLAGERTSGNVPSGAYLLSAWVAQIILMVVAVGALYSAFLFVFFLIPFGRGATGGGGTVLDVLVLPFALYAIAAFRRN